MAEYLRLDSRKVTYSEYWNIARSPTVIIPWVAKLLRIPMNFGSGFQRVEAVRELAVPESAFSPAAREKLQPWLEESLAQGFHSAQFYCFKSLGGETATSFITLLHGSGDCSIRLMHSVAAAGAVSQVTVLVVVLSEFYDDTFLVTSNQRAKFLSPPGVVVGRLLKGNPAQVLALHQQKLEALQLSNRTRKIVSLEAQDAVWDRYEKLSNDFGIQRGIYVPLKPEDQAAAMKKADVVKAFKAEGVENADVLAELNQLQDKKGGWGNAILIFVISMFLFVGAGSKQWSWQFVLMLVPILFIHELGHYVAMRWFNYRNLRMFFIPFFGAAVSGRHYNVPGWKKVVVSMMGPVPGILLGVVIGSAGLILDQPMMIKVALVTLLLNGSNLLPFLPLDGGWIFHALIFSRHYLLDAAFRVLAVVALMLAGIFTDSKILLFVGVPMLLGIPAAYRMARTVTALRQRGVPPASADDQTIPTETAQIIIAELKQGLPKAYTPKMIAEQTLQVFETLNARPPGWLATVGLLFVHFASVAMAVVFGVVLFVGQRGDLAGMLSAAIQVPKHKLACNSMSVWRGDLAYTIETNEQATLIATFPKSAAAARAFESMTNHLPTDAVLQVFGETLLLSLPADDETSRKQWLAELQEQTSDVFVDNTNFPASFSLSVLAPDDPAAKALEEELREYLDTFPIHSLVPPWLPDDERSAAQRAQHQLARQTYLKLSNREDSTYDSEDTQALQKKMTQARKQADKAEIESLRKEMQQLYADAEKEHIANIRAESPELVDTNIIDLYIAQQAVSEEEANLEKIQRPARAMARLMGQVAPGDARYLVRYGSVTREGLLLNLNWISFERPIDGAPALVDWLCAKGCTDLRYSFRAGSEIDDE